MHSQTAELQFGDILKIISMKEIADNTKCFQILILSTDDTAFSTNLINNDNLFFYRSNNLETAIKIFSESQIDLIISNKFHACFEKIICSIPYLILSKHPKKCCQNNTHQFFNNIYYISDTLSTEQITTIIHSIVAKADNLPLVYTSINTNEKVIQVRDKILSNISHDIRTPLNGILGFTSLLIDDCISHEKKQEYFSIISESTDRLIGYIDNISLLYNIELDLVRVKKTKIECISFIKALNNHFQNKIGNNDIDILIELKPSDGHIYSDSHILMTIITKLLFPSLYSFSGTGSLGFTMEIKEETFTIVLKSSVFNNPDLILLNYNLDQIKDEAYYLDYNSIEILQIKKYIEMLNGKIEHLQYENNTYEIIIAFQNLN